MLPLSWGWTALLVELYRPVKGHLESSIPVFFFFSTFFFFSFFLWGLIVFKYVENIFTVFVDGVWFEQWFRDVFSVFF